MSRPDQRREDERGGQGDLEGGAPAPAAKAANVRRKLTTILCADIEGYSRLMGEDEVGTLERLKQHRAAMAALIERHEGRVVNTWGDGLIAEFPSVVEAVHCAVETQRELGARNRMLEPGRRLEYRIGVNLGDVMVEDGDLYGEGVNVAARLQALSDPGGIMIAGSVHDQVRTKLSMRYEFTGAQHVKNVAEPVPAYRVHLDQAAEPGPVAPSLPETRAAQANAPVARGPLGLATGGVVVAALASINLFTALEGGNVWFHWPALAVAIVLALRWALRR